MTLPIPDDDDVMPPVSGANDRPDWLVHTDHDLGQVSRRPAPIPPPTIAGQGPVTKPSSESRPTIVGPGTALPPPPGGVLRLQTDGPGIAEGLVRPLVPDVPLPALPLPPGGAMRLQAQDSPGIAEGLVRPVVPDVPLPALPPSGGALRLEGSGVAEGLVRPAVPNVPLPAASSEWEQTQGFDPTTVRGFGAPPQSATEPALAAALSMDQGWQSPAAGEPEAPTPDAHDEAPAASGAWSAAASSIPTLRLARRRAAAADEPAPQAEWAEDPPLASPRAAHAKVVASAQEIHRTQDPVSAAVKRTARVTGPVLVAGAGLLVALAVGMGTLILRPKEEFVSIQHIKENARALDGQIVKMQGTVGQSFPVGGGFSYYLHDSRDTIVVFTRVRTPVEGEQVKLVGKVSTGYLDGAPRAAIFEDPPPPK